MFYEIDHLEADTLPTCDRYQAYPGTAELELSEGDWVTYGDGKRGVVIATFDSTFTWPTGEDDEMEVEVAEGETWAIVARESGGSKPFPESELTASDGPTIPDDVGASDLEDAELAQVYYVASDPHEIEELQTARAELVSVPGVESGNIGFDSWPPSWRKSAKPGRVIALDAWTSMGATFRGCVAEMQTSMARPQRFCAAFKDEMLGTERWRNRF